jgi:A/G-specific adenine glycosylase
MTTDELREIIWEYYAKNGRTMPWREEPYDPYRILVSELMLQQTQVPRVIPKYTAFLEHFPTVQSLANASLAEVLLQWQGLGYNRRAKYLHEAAKQLVTLPEPWSYEQLVACKGIGPNTAAAVVVYSYNQPLLFIETNIRTVLIHHLFADADVVHDKRLLEQLHEVLDHEHPREFYWALMDYGTHLKQSHGNAARRSQHYKKQSMFKGSKRAIRGAVIRYLSAQPGELEALVEAVDNDARLPEVLTDLLREGLIECNNMRYQLAS